MRTINYLRLVEDFHASMCYRWPSPVLPSFDKETCELLVRLIQEELDELMDAIEKDNQLGQLDACCDLQYVISGAALALGIRAFYPAAVSCCKPTDYDLPDIKLQLSALAHSLFNTNTPGAWMALARMETALHSTVKSLGFDDVFDDAFAEVHRSNMAKTFSESEANDHSGNYNFTRNQFGRYIGSRADGKIIKPPGFTPPDLSAFIQ